MVVTFLSLPLAVFLGLWPDALKNLKSPHLVFYTVIGFSIVSVILFTVFIYQMWRDTHAIRNSYYKIHEINHSYRDALARSVFHPHDGFAHTADHVLAHANREVDTLSTVVQKISLIYRELTGAPCMVAVKVCDKRDNAEVCFAIARSERETGRDQTGEAKFSLDPNKNTAFAEARKPHKSGASHFHSPDLIALAESNKYHNEREDWRRFYKSCIVVPIRYNRQTATPECREIGFLSVDTRARHRLNDTFHVQLLAAFADQMYNYINLSRGNLLNTLLKNTSNQPTLPLTAKL